MRSKNIASTKLQFNSGQIEGLPQNPRFIRDERYEKLLNSIKSDPEMLELREVIAYDNDGQLVVIAGNMRLRAAIELDIAMIPTKILPSDTPVSKLKAYTIKDNISYGQDDFDLLANEWELEDLQEWGLELPDVDLSDLNDEDDDLVPEIATGAPVSKLGDLWLLGNHRVLCGDSTDKTTVERLMDGKKADMVFTDPPYGMNLDTDYSKLPSTKATGNKTHKAVIGDDKPFDYQLFAWLQQPEQIWFGANYYAKTLPDCGSWLVWDKRVEEKFDKMFGSGFEIAWSKTRHKQKIYRHNNTLFGGDTEARGKEHPTQKPTKLCIEMIDDIKDIKSVLDPFLGSGSTLIACEQTDRICYGMELDPQYVDVICKRYQLLTGELPILESTGDAHNFADDVQ